MQNIILQQYFYRYIVATQDKSLQNTLYHLPAIPVMHFNGLSIILKAPSPTSIEHANKNKQSRYDIFFLFLQFLKNNCITLLIFNYL